MASIALTSKEYDGLTAKAKMCDELIDCILDAYKVEVDPSSSWRPVSITLKPEWPEDIVERIVQTVGKKLSESPTAMDYIAKSEEFIFDLEERQLDDLPYNERLYYGQYNLLECCEDFSTEYNGRKIEAELQLEEKKAEEEEEE